MKKFAILIILFVVFFSGCNISNQKLAKRYTTQLFGELVSSSYSLFF